MTKARQSAGPSVVRIWHSLSTLEVTGLSTTLSTTLSTQAGG